MDKINLKNLMFYQAKSLNKLGCVCKWVGKINKARFFINKSQRINKKISDNYLKIDNLWELSATYWSSSKFLQSYKYLTYALNISRQLNNIERIIRNINSIGVNLWGLGEYSKSIENFKKSINLAKKIKNIKLEAISLGNLALVYQTLGEYYKSLDSNKQSLEICVRIGNKIEEEINYINIAGIYLRLNEYTKCVNYLNHALRIAREIKYRRGEAICLSTFGDVYFDLKEYNKALNYYQNSLEICKETNSKTYEIYNLSYIGLTNLHINRLEHALYNSKIAVSNLIKYKNIEDSQVVLFNHYKILLAYGNLMSDKKIDEPEKYLKMAYDSVMETALKIKDGNLRKSFLESVKINREIIEEWNKINSNIKNQNLK
jgi:tetratricopeptide (TPR) repeat protein